MLCAKQGATGVRDGVNGWLELSERLANCNGVQHEVWFLVLFDQRAQGRAAELPHHLVPRAGADWHAAQDVLDGHLYEGV